MKSEEYLKTIVYNGHMINIGIDDAGQGFFLEYLDENGNLIETSCGAYNLDYQYYIEYLFGEPTQCVAYNTGLCSQWTAHGYCFRCPYNQLMLEAAALKKQQSAGGMNDDCDQQGIGTKSN